MDYRYFEPTYYPRHTTYQPQYVPPNRPTSDYLPQLSRSSSTGTHYYNQEYYTPVTSRRRRNKIDRFVYEDEDGEPMNDLEVIAKKNAAKNERQSKIVYPDRIKENDYTPATAAETFDDSEVVHPNTTSSVSSFDSTLVGSESSTSHHKKATTTEPSEQPNDGKESSVTTTVEPESNSTVQATNKKKKRSLFSCLFKKIVSAPPLPSPHHSSPLLPPLPTPSFSTPPTPVLSPDNNTQGGAAGGVNSVSSSTTSSPFEEIASSDGTWVFSYPTLVPVTPTVWIQFDLENQKRIADHVRSKLPVVQFMDSHIGAGTVLCTVSLLQKACFIPFGNQFTRLELSYIPPRC